MQAGYCLASIADGVERIGKVAGPVQPAAYGTPADNLAARAGRARRPIDRPAEPADRPTPETAVAGPSF
jgi:hypothetical protein